jgi:hypothetical protein
MSVHPELLVQGQMYRLAKVGIRLMIALAILLGNIQYTASAKFSPRLLGAVTDCANISITGIPQLECEALLTLYNNTDGPNWGNSFRLAG